MRTYKSATFAGFSKLAMGCYGYIIYSFTAANVRSGKIKASNAFSFSAMHPGTYHPENMSFLNGPKAMLLVVGCGPSVELRSKNLPMIFRRPTSADPRDVAFASQVEMEGVVEKWTRTFAATEADGAQELEQLGWCIL